MGIWEALTELVDLAKPWSEAEAEAPAKDEDQKVCRFRDWRAWKCKMELHDHVPIHRWHLYKREPTLIPKSFKHATLTHAAGR